MSKATVKQSKKFQGFWRKRFKDPSFTDCALEWASVIIITPALVYSVASLQNLPI